MKKGTFAIKYFGNKYWIYQQRSAGQLPDDPLSILLTWILQQINFGNIDYWKDDEGDITSLTIGEKAAWTFETLEQAEEHARGMLLAIAFSSIHADAREAGVYPNYADTLKRVDADMNEFGLRNTEMHFAQQLVKLLKRMSDKTFKSILSFGQADSRGVQLQLAGHLMERVGARGVLLDPGCCDPLYRKAIRVSVGAALTTPFARLEAGADIAEVLIGLGYQPLALSPEGGERLADLRRDGPAAVVVGAEGPGLSETLMARCRRVSIPMATGWDSLNVATAAAIALHQLRFAAPS